jgi:hypothetical protein
VGHPAGTLGSIGPFVTFPGGRTGFISTCFAIAAKRAKPGDFIHQPGPAHLEILTGSTRVAVLEKIAAPEPGVPTSVASAAAMWLEGAEPGRHVLPEWSMEAGRAISGVVEPDEIGMTDEVAFVGCGSVYGRGRIIATALQGVKVEKFIFNDVIQVEGLTGPFSRTGDGGALVYRCSDCRAIGLLFARAQEMEGRPKSLVLPLGPTLRALDVKLM